MKITTVVLAVLALFIQTTKADTTFDGSWSVTLDAKVFNNPDGSKVQPFVLALLRDRKERGLGSASGKEMTTTSWLRD